jgi:hypothetical protein
MLMAGIAVLLRRAHAFVDFSTWRLFFVPLLAFCLAMGVTLALIWAVPMQNLWLAAAIKLASFAAVYLAVWLAMEHKDVRRMLSDLHMVFAK